MRTMLEAGTERAGTLILRAWSEARHDGNLRIRVVSVVGKNEQILGVAASIDEVEVLIRFWLENLLGRNQADAD